MRVNQYGYGQAYQQGFGSTVRFLLSRGVPRDSAREAAQAAWVKGWERLHQLRDESTVGAWVNMIALNAYRGVVRKESNNTTLIESTGPTGISIAAIDMSRILGECRARDRNLLEECLRGATTQEIAKKLGVTDTTIRIRLLRARRAARLRIEERAVRLRARQPAFAARDAA
jgi:DNA-directed RNA polymerase specialized sigma24 family protein